MENALIERLVERLERLTGPDREVDYAIAEMVMPFLRDYRREPGDRGYYSDTPFIEGANKIAPVECYTDSLDAAVDLIGRELKWSWRVGNTPSGRGFAYLGTSQAEHVGATPAIALCIAAVKALARAPTLVEDDEGR